MAFISVICQPADARMLQQRRVSPPTYELGDIATVLRSGLSGAARPRALVLRIQAGPPLPQGGGWLEADQSRAILARLKHRSVNGVRLSINPATTKTAPHIAKLQT